MEKIKMKMFLQQLKKSVIMLGVTVGMLAAIQTVASDSFANWGAISRKLEIARGKNSLTVSNKSKEKNQTGLQAKLADVKIDANTTISFEWKCDSTGAIYYSAFLFKIASGNSYYIFNQGGNAFKNPALATWHKVEILATQLKTLKSQPVKVGAVLTGLRFWQAGKTAQSLSIRNFKVENINSSKTAKLKLAAAAGDGVQIWPRSSTVSLPTGLEQFIFIEFPSIKTEQDLNIRLTLPPAITIKGYPTASYKDALPLRSVLPVKPIQSGNILDFTVTANDASRFLPSAFWVTLSADVETAPGMYKLKVEVFNAKKMLSSKTLPVKIYPKLKTVKLKQLRSIVFNYNGLVKKHIPTYVNMLIKSGVNEIQNMHGETPDHGKIYREDSVSSYALKHGLKLSLVFFVHNAVNYAKANNILQEKNIQWNLTWLLNHPSSFQKILKKYLEHATAGLNYSAVNIDSETTAYRRGKIAGDLSEYGLKDFQKFANIAATVKLSPELIKQKYLKLWVKYRCQQSNKISENVRELLDEQWPDRGLDVYSGYKFNESPYKDRTKRNYGVDWESMADTGLDYGIAGYGGSMNQIQATAKALAGKASFIPGEMAQVNFYTKRKFKKTPEVWSMRLINAFLHSGMKGGLAIWCGNVLSSSNLISMNIAFDFMQQVEPFVMKGKRVDGAVKVSPKSEQDNVYVLRKGGNSLIIAINSDRVAKQLRIRLVDFTLKGYTSDLDIKDLVSGKKIKTKRVLKIKIAPFSYRLLSLMDDGN